jgi:hypothetical protein
MRGRRENYMEMSALGGFVVRDIAGVCFDGYEPLSCYVAL